MATKHNKRGKFIYKEVWSFKKNFKRDYLDREEFNKNKYKFIKYGSFNN